MRTLCVLIFCSGFISFQHMFANIHGFYERMELEALPNIGKSTITSDKLDSISTYSYDGSDFSLYRNVYFEYDKHGFVTQERSFWKADNKWLAEYKYVYGYDADGNVNLIEKYWAEHSNGVLVGDEKQEKTYDKQGRVTQEVRYEWSGSKWVEFEKINVSFDQYGHYQIYNRYRFNKKHWVEVEKVELFSDYEGRIQKEHYYTNNKLGLNLIEKTEYSYQDNLIEQAIYTYYDQVWTCSHKNLITVDHLGNKTSEIEYSWDGSLWVKSFKNEYSYNAHGLNTVKARYEWDQSNMAWIGSTKFNWDYDPVGNPISSEYVKWDIQQGKWEEGGSIEQFKFNINTNLSESHASNLSEDFYRIDEKMKAQYHNGSYEITSKTVYHYSNIASSKEGKLPKDLSYARLPKVLLMEQFELKRSIVY